MYNVLEKLRPLLENYSTGMFHTISRHPVAPFTDMV